MDYELLGSELLRALRGKRSQAAFGRRLGYDANVSYTWESGRRFPPAHVLFRAASLNHIPLQPMTQFARSSEATPKRDWAASDTAAVLRGLAGSSLLATTARAAGVDRTTVARWLRGNTEPRVPQLLAFIDGMTHRLVEFVTLFVAPESLPTLRELSQELAAQRRIAYELPWSHAVLRTLELDAYQSRKGHVPGLIARAIGIGVDEEEDLLKALHAARLIRRHRGKWVPSRVITVDTRADPERDLRLKQHWAEVGLDRLRRRRQTARADALHSYNLFAVSRADFLRLRELHLEYYERVRRLVAESNEAERVVLLNLQLIPLDEAAASQAGAS
jgi:transcriptional regulator with XRE-family HTH domain